MVSGQETLKILIIGSGGREHTLAWKMAQSPKVRRLYAAPGNGGISQVAECVNIQAEDIAGLLKFSQDKGIDLVVVGPEGPLAAGVVDTFQRAGIPIFGPTAEAAQLESSKVFAKEFMRKCGIPTAEFKAFDRAEEAKAYVESLNGAPVVIKADGLCAGKGVIVASNKSEALGAVSLMMEDMIFGPSGRRIIIEECLEGNEASLFCFSDGKTLTLLDSSQDHKRAEDGDKGRNTGGMGAYSPAPVVTRQILDEVKARIMDPIRQGFKDQGLVYQGVLYLGLMLTEKGPQVLEFNVRMGDPEAQVLVPRLQTDLVDLILATVEGKLSKLELKWDPRSCVGVVMASGGYPGSYETGYPISGLEEAEEDPDVVVFHAGTRRQEGADGSPAFLTSGGRVLAVTALGETVKEAVDRAYAAVSKVQFKDAHYRKDIAHRALKQLIPGTQ